MNVLFVCSGNTCRSPLAVAAWRALRLAENDRAGRAENKVHEAAIDEFALEAWSPADAASIEESVSPSAAMRLTSARLLERDADSAGLAAEKGALAARNALASARDWEQDLSVHRARRLSRDMARHAPLICTMTVEQSLAVCAHFGASVERVRPLGEFAAWCDDAQASARALEEERLAALFGHAPRPLDHSDDIADPYGGSLEAYRCCAAQIHRAVAGLRIALRRGEAHLR